jgi:hypothetical protein
MGSRRRAYVGRLACLTAIAAAAFALPAGAATGWTATPSPNPVGSHQTYLDSVACIKTAPVHCFSVGSYVSATGAVRTLVEQWNGTTWTVVSSPNRAGIASSLVGIACPTVSSCFAVGNSQATPTAPALTLIEHWAGPGHPWTIMPSPNAPQSTGNFLHGISCVGAQCFAVGNFTSGATLGSTLTEHLSGGVWKITASPNRAGAAVNNLAGVSCNASGTGLICAAVGTYSNRADGSVPLTLAERWNGGSWVYVASANHLGYKTTLNAVSCSSTTFCMAVGLWQHAPGASFSERWNGKAWTEVPVANHLGFTFSELNSVFCSGPTNCIAVGAWASGATTLTLVEQWNGAAWIPLASPSPAASNGAALTGVSCATGRCFAVGAFLSSAAGGQSVTLTEHN